MLYWGTFENQESINEVHEEKKETRGIACLDLILEEQLKREEYYKQLGKRYFEIYSQNSDNELDNLCRLIRESNEKIESFVRKIQSEKSVEESSHWEHSLKNKEYIQEADFLQKEIQQEILSKEEYTEDEERTEVVVCEEDIERERRSLNKKYYWIEG